MYVRYNVVSNMLYMCFICFIVMIIGLCMFYFYHIYNMVCEMYVRYLIDIKWFQIGNGTGNDSGSFDRIDSNVGYREGNVRITCRICNVRKSDSPVDEWVGLLEVRIRNGIISCVDETLLQFLSA